MTRFVGLDVSQKLTAICIVDETGRRLWRGQCATDPGQIERMGRGHAGEDARIGVETGPMTPWLVHELRSRELNVTCLDARHASAALKVQMNKNDQNDAEGLAQIIRTGWYRPVYVKSLDAHRARALLGARAQLVGMTTRLSNHIRGVLKTFGMLPGAMRGLPFDRRVEELLVDRDDLTPIVGPMLAAWRQLREQIAAFDKAVRVLAKADPTCRLLMSVPGLEVLSVLAYVSTVEDPARFARSRSVGAHMGLTPRQYQSGEVDRSGRISTTLSETPKSFTPLFERDAKGDVEIGPWCRGFHAAIQLNPKFWRKLLPVRGLAHLWLIPILAHCVDDDGRPVHGAPPLGPLTELARFDADREIPGAVAAIREFWKPTRYRRLS